MLKLYADRKNKPQKILKQNHKVGIIVIFSFLSKDSKKHYGLR